MRRGHKLLLPFAGEALVRAPVRAALAAGFDRVGLVVGGEPGVREAVADLAVEPIANPEAERGVSASVERALAWAGERAEAVLLLLADEPGVHPETIRALVEAWRAQPTLAARCRYADRPGHPVIVAVPLPAAAAPAGDRGLGGWIASLGPAALEVVIDRPAPVDVDTDADYLSALARLPH